MPSSLRRHTRAHTIVGALALLLTQCGRFGFETLPVLEDAPILVGNPASTDSCFDGVQNQTETAIDCGGVCPACSLTPTATCFDGVSNQDETAVDCGGVCGACTGGTLGTCADGIQNQDETAIDCGGVCPACSVAPTATCFDGIQNQDETAIDCGGVCPACSVAPTATCTDGIQNQSETAVDCGGVCPACVPTECNQVLADSEADFSSIQGSGGWYYGYYAEPQLGSSDFQQLTIYEYVPSLDEDLWRFGDQAWTHMGARVMHPNGRFTSGGKLAIDQYAVRRWVSSTSETLLVQGTVQLTGVSDNGVLARIRVGDTEVWQQFVGPALTSPLAFETLVSVQVGDAVNFLVEPFESNDGGDATDFVVQLCR